MRGQTTALYAREVWAIREAAKELRWNADTNAKANSHHSNRMIMLARRIENILVDRGLSEPRVAEEA